MADGGWRMADGHGRNRPYLPRAYFNGPKSEPDPGRQQTNRFKIFCYYLLFVLRTQTLNFCLFSYSSVPLRSIRLRFYYLPM